MNTSDYIAGAALIIAIVSATFTGAQVYLQFLQFRNDRHRLVVYPYVSGDPRDYKRIFIANLASYPIIVLHWQLYWRSGRWPIYKYEPINIYDNDDLYLEIPNRKRVELAFEEANSFEWDPQNKGKVDLVLGLSIAGKRRESLHFVYTPYSKK